MQNTGTQSRNISKNSRLWSLVTGILLLANPAAASVTFSDSTFDTLDYAIPTFQTGGATITTSQTLSQGNPDSALRSVIDVPAGPGTFYTSQYIINQSFAYDPGTQGEIQSIDFTTDVYFEVFNVGLGFRFAEAVVEQNGQLYLHSVSVPTVNGSWETASTTGLVASDFDLVTDLLRGTLDSTSHPDFTIGAMLLGSTARTITSTAAAHSMDARLDNLSFTVNSTPINPGTVPLPGVLWLLGAGLILLGAKTRYSTERRSRT